METGKIKILMENLKNGNKNARDELILNYYPTILKIIESLKIPEDLREEAIQEGFMVATQVVDSYHDGNYKTPIYTSMHVLIEYHLNKWKLSREKFDEISSLEKQDMEEKYMEEYQIQIIKNAIESMPDLETMRKYYFEEKSLRMLSCEYHCSYQNISLRLKSELEKLQEYLLLRSILKDKVVFKRLIDRLTLFYYPFLNHIRNVLDDFIPDYISNQKELLFLITNSGKRIAQRDLLALSTEAKYNFIISVMPRILKEYYGIEKLIDLEKTIGPVLDSDKKLLSALSYQTILEITQEEVLLYVMAEVIPKTYQSYDYLNYFSKIQEERMNKKKLTRK